MLENLEDKIEQKMDNIGWIPKLLFGPEYNAMRATLDESRALRADYEPTEEWFLEYGETINKSFDIIYNTIDEAHMLYESVKSIPIVGDYLAGIAEDYITEMLPKKPVKPQQASGTADLPAGAYDSLDWGSHEFNQVTSIVTHAQNFTLAGYSQYAADVLGVESDWLYKNVKREPEKYESEPSIFRSTFYGFADAIGDIFVTDALATAFIW